MLTDAYGRVATDLRVSLTDRCNLRCAYCMPPEGLDWLPAPEVLTGDEIVRLITIGVEALGIREVRFTGGEPLPRRDLADIIAATAALEPRPDISLTTNGIGLDRRAAGLKAAGLDRINVSLDTLRPEVFRKLTRRDRRRGGRADAGQGQRGADARPERRRGTRAARLLPRARLRAADHRADAARRAARLETNRDGHRGRGSRLAFGRVRAFRRYRTDAWRCAGRDLPRQRRAGPSRGDRRRHSAVLRNLRPGAADRRRPDPQLPVRPVRKRPAVGPALRRDRCRDRRPVAGGGLLQAARARGQRRARPPAGAADVRDPRIAGTDASRRSSLVRPAFPTAPSYSALRASCCYL